MSDGNGDDEGNSEGGGGDDNRDNDIETMSTVTWSVVVRVTASTSATVSFATALKAGLAAARTKSALVCV